MAGTKAGHAKARSTLIKKLGLDGYLEFMHENSSKGGKGSTGGGFAKMSHERLIEISSKGGKARWSKET